MDVADTVGPRAQDWARLLPFLREIGDLKRIQTPDVRPSLAAVGFRSLATRAFHDPRADWHELAVHGTAHGVAATRLGGIRVDDLRAAGLNREARETIFQRALEERGDVLGDALSRTFRAARFESTVVDGDDAVSREWIERLIGQPRAGATAPGVPRLVLEPVESCAEHCYVTALYGVLLAPYYGAALDEAFVIGLAHHAHNARLADAGFAGEALLGEYLEPVVENLRRNVIDTFAPSVTARITALFEQIAAADTPLARTFHAADTVDRVLQMEYFERCNAFTLETALVDMDIVHEGPVQAFQKAQLANAGLIDP